VNKRRRTLIEDADNKDIPSSADGSAPSDASSSSMAVDKYAPARNRKRSRKRSRRPKPPLKPSNDEAMDVDSTDAPKSLPTPGTRSTSGTTMVSSFTLPSQSAEDNLHPQMDKAKVSLPLHRAVVEITTAIDGSSRLGMYVVVNDSNTPTHGMQAEILKPKRGGLGMRNPSPNNEQEETLW